MSKKYTYSVCTLSLSEFYWCRKSLQIISTCQSAFRRLKEPKICLARVQAVQDGVRSTRMAARSPWQPSTPLWLSCHLHCRPSTCRGNNRRAGSDPCMHAPLRSVRGETEQPSKTLHESIKDTDTGGRARESQQQFTLEHPKSLYCSSAPPLFTSARYFCVISPLPKTLLGL